MTFFSGFQINFLLGSHQCRIQRLLRHSSFCNDKIGVGASIPASTFFAAPYSPVPDPGTVSSARPAYPSEAYGPVLQSPAFFLASSSIRVGFTCVDATNHPPLLFRSTDQGICHRYVSARFSEEWKQLPADGQCFLNISVSLIPGIHILSRKHPQILHRSGRYQRELPHQEWSSALWPLYHGHMRQTAGSWCLHGIRRVLPSPIPFILQSGQRRKNIDRRCDSFL